jgi:mannose-6-phosphate isomerase-like protein (cupin superfamily)
MPSWRTCDLPENPHYTWPSGVSEIRLLPSLAEGELAHATASPESVSAAAVLTSIAEFFYVLEGQGELWRKQGDVEQVVELSPQHCYSIPAGVEFQYRVGPEPLRFIVCSAPRWQREKWQEASTAYWPDAAVLAATADDPPWRSVALPAKMDRLAPDGSEIRFLLEVDAGGLAHCTLPAGRFSQAVRHRTVQEVWYILAGVGELWRSEGGDEAEIVRLHPGRGLTIPPSASFQFRAMAPEGLQILIGTFPRWPEGEEEAVPVEPHWR